MKLLLLSIVQSVLLAGGQVLLKLALQCMGTPGWNWQFISHNLTNWWWLGCGLCFGAAGLLWMFIVKHFPLSMAYPLVSLSYVIGMIAAMVVFHEHIPATRWIGVFLIMTGCILIVK